MHRPVAGTFTATNTWGRATVTPVEGQVGRTRDLWSDVAEGQMTQGQVDVARDATRLELTITPRQSDADLDVYLFGRNGLVAQSTTIGPGIRADRGAQPAARHPRDRGGGASTSRAGRRSSTTTSGPTRAGSAASASRPAPGSCWSPARSSRSRRTVTAYADAGQRPTPRGPGAVRQPARVGDRLRRGADQRGHHPRRRGAGRRRRRWSATT